MEHKELIQWSDRDDRHGWQRDALRRIVCFGEITKQDLQELKKIIENDVGIIVDKNALPEPLLSRHLPKSAEDAPRTTLLSIGSVHGIDRLADDQKPLSFLEDGLTLVYGPNASGKSGYCRIAKRLCRSRSAQEIRGNVYDESSNERWKVNFEYSVEGQGNKKLSWAGEELPEELNRISVFDTADAQIYVDRDRKLEFLPYELSVLTNLANCSTELNEHFKRCIEKYNINELNSFIDSYNEGTKIHKELSRILLETELTELPDEEHLRNLAVWNEENISQLRDIEKKIANSPESQRNICRTAKSQLEALMVEISKCTALIGNMEVKTLKTIHDTKRQKAQEAELAASNLSADLPIPGVGSDAWRQMLVYAREFAAEVTTEEKASELSETEFCMLCQQPLADDARQRMKKFDEYIIGRAVEESKKAEEVYNKRVQDIMGLKISTVSELDDSLATYAGMTDERNELFEQIKKVYVKLARRYDLISNMIGTDSIEAVDTEDFVSKTLIEQINLDIQALGDEMAALNGAIEAGSQHQEVLMKSHAELVDLRKLNMEIDTAVDHLKRLKLYRKYHLASQQCSTAAIGRQMTKRRGRLLSDSLKERLANEMRSLDVAHIPITLSERSSKGDSVVGLELISKQSVKRSSEILSEGEHRSLALACFLAELGEKGTKHGIVVDDPISSLDHTRMEAVAERLVHEASAGRQVIVFTHNISFRYMVESQAAAIGLEPCVRWMTSRGKDKFGVIDSEDDVPDQLLKAGQRINRLNETVNDIFKDGYEPSDVSKEKRDKVVAFYTFMRETWEKIVEEIIFNNVIERYHPDVKTHSLDTAYYNPQEDYDRINNGMTRCSAYSGHSRPSSSSLRLPTEDQIRKDLQNLVTFHSDVKKRRKTLQEEVKAKTMEKRKMGRTIDN